MIASSRAHFTPQCLAAVQDVTHQVEQALTNPKLLATIQAKFQSSDVKSGLDFLSVLASMVDGAVQYGMQEGFCDTLLGSADHSRVLLRAESKFCRRWA